MCESKILNSVYVYAGQSIDQLVASNMSSSLTLKGIHVEFSVCLLQLLLAHAYVGL